MIGFRTALCGFTFCLALLWATGQLPAIAQESLADLGSFRNGCQALADQRFETAAEELKKAWVVLESEEAGDVEKNFVAVRLVEALVRNGDSAAAVEWSRKHAEFQLDPQSTRWIALAYQNEKLFSEAADLYNSLASGNSLNREAKIDRALCLSASGQGSLAYEIAVECGEPISPSESVLFARIATRAEEFEAADAFLSNIDSEQLTPEEKSLVFRIRLWKLLRQGKRDEAARLVCDRIDSAANSEEARHGFLLLESISQDTSSSETAARLKDWIENPEHPASEAARLFEAILTKPLEERVSRLTGYLGGSPPPELAMEAELRIRQLAQNPEIDTTESTRVIPGDLRNRLQFGNSSALYFSGQFEKAAKSFQETAAAEKGNFRATSLHNAAVSALRAEDIALFSSIRRDLRTSDPRSPLLADLDYIGGLYYASRGDSKAFDMLNAFVRERPDHPAHVDAQLALAEIQLNQAPARPLAAREIVDQLRLRPLTLLQSERLDYIAIWTEIADNNSSEVVRLAEAFLNDWPSSSYRSEIGLLLAGKLYAQKNFAGAKKYFDFVAENFPSSPNAETAEFFAAKSSPPEPDTIELWNGIIEEGGEFALQARHELGLLLLSLDRFEEARTQFSDLIAREDCPPELRFAVTADLGFSWYAEALSEDRNSEKLETAAGVYAELSRNQEASRFWRYSAAVRRAKCLEALGNRTVALEIYRSIVEEAQATNAFLDSELSLSETDWVFRAGFSAIQILSGEEDWKGAIKLADTLSQKDGPRAIEAARLAEQLRLKHWVWE